MCVLSIKVPIRKKSGNLSYAPRKSKQCRIYIDGKENSDKKCILLFKKKSPSLLDGSRKYIYIYIYIYKEIFRERECEREGGYQARLVSLFANLYLHLFICRSILLAVYHLVSSIFFFFYSLNLRLSGFVSIPRDVATKARQNQNEACKVKSA